MSHCETCSRIEVVTDLWPKIACDKLSVSEIWDDHLTLRLLQTLSINQPVEMMLMTFLHIGTDRHMS